MRISARFLTQIGAAVYGALLVLVASPAGAAIPLSNTPLFLTVTMPPNITLTLDDSGSMSRAWVPEICPGTGDIRLGQHIDGISHVNHTPANQASPPTTLADGTTLFTEARDGEIEIQQAFQITRLQVGKITSLEKSGRMLGVEDEDGRLLQIHHRGGTTPVSHFDEIDALIADIQALNPYVTVQGWWDG